MGHILRGLVQKVARPNDGGNCMSIGEMSNVPEKMLTQTVWKVTSLLFVSTGYSYKA